MNEENKLEFEEEFTENEDFEEKFTENEDFEEEFTENDFEKENNEVKKDAKEKLVEVKEKIGVVTDKIKVKLETKKLESEQIKPIVSARILFISVLDKFLLLCLLLMFLSGTYFNLVAGYHGFMSMVFTEIKIIILVAIVYFFLNWLYKCAAKTMLCLTNNEVYFEMHAPFVNSEMSLPLTKITGVTTVNFFWIFRFIIIHQYGKLPLVFGTWKNQEFKDELNKLITTDKGQIENEYQNRNILSKKSLKLLKYLGLGLAGLMILVGIGNAFKYITSPARKVPGTYVYMEEKIEFKSNGKCNIDDISDEDVTECKWRYEEKSNTVRVDYKYTYYSYYSGSTIRSDYFSLKHDKDEKTLTYYGDVFTKQK